MHLKKRKKKRKLVNLFNILYTGYEIIIKFIIKFIFKVSYLYNHNIL